MSEPSPSIVTYLTDEIRELIRLGPVHAMTWVSERDPGCWMQVSVHEGSEHYLTVLCVLPPRVTKTQLDKLLGKVGRRQTQANHGTCLIYYLAQSDGPVQLYEQSPVAAQQCASIIELLWNVQTVEQFQLLGTRGPRIPLYGGERQSIPRSKQAERIESKETIVLPGNPPALPRGKDEGEATGA
jgi:hypothetical protein